ncbi:MAG: transporter substrate-binding domain-containing protein [Duncaniella sp.]|nr:transporter substrate-binding domain-containing protein [Duncaniella sp.]
MKLKDILRLTPQRLFVIVLAVLAIGVAAAVMHSHGGASRGAAAVYNRGDGDTVNVAIAYSPMSLYRYGDTLGGLNYDIMKALAREYGMAVKFHPVTSAATALERLGRGDYDILMADIPVTASIKERYRVSVPVYTDHLVLVSCDSTLTSALQLAGKEVWVVKDSPAAERLENLAREIGDSIDIRSSDDYNAEQLVMLVSAGVIPRAVVNRAVAQSLMPDCPDLKIATRISLSQFQSWFFRKDERALADTIDARLERFQTTPAYRDIIAQWAPGSL